MKAIKEDNQAFLDLLVTVADDSDYETRSYSGRDMYGEHCIGIVMDDDSSIAFLAYNIGRADEDEVAASYMERVATDNIGLNTIVYFPSVKVADEEESEAA